MLVNFEGCEGIEKHPEDSGVFFDEGLFFSVTLIFV